LPGVHKSYENRRAILPEYTLKVYEDDELELTILAGYNVTTRLMDLNSPGGVTIHCVFAPVLNLPEEEPSENNPLLIFKGTTAGNPAQFGGLPPDVYPRSHLQSTYLSSHLR
jgi:hypothetical protein